MPDEVLTAPLFRFGVFEMDLRTGELRKSGKRVRLAPQPFKLLVMLAGKPGELVTREEIQQEIWGDNTVVDYEQGLSFLVKKVRAALGDHSDSPRYIETLPRRGYRFIAPVEAVAPGTERLDVDAASTARRWGPLWMSSAGLIVIIAVFLGLNVGGLRDRISGKSLPHIQSVAVLPFDNLSGDPKQDYLADEMTEELIAELSKIGQLRVIGRTSVMGYKASTKPVRVIARELNVDAVIEASVLRSGDRVHINLRLVDGSTERVLWEEPFERDLADVPALHSAVATQMAHRIRIRLTPEEQKRLASASPVNPRAYEAYLRGRYLFNKRTGEDIRRGIGYFEQAVQLDPNYAPAYADIANSYVQLEYYGPIPFGTSRMKAREAARKAVALDDSLAEGHTALALVLLRQDLDWSAAEDEFRRAIMLNPGYATAHFRYGFSLIYMGRNEEALAQMKEARNREPLSLIINSGLGTALFFRGEYDQAIRQWQKTQDLDPTFWLLRLYLGWGYLAEGLPDDAVRELEAAVKLSKGHPSALGWLGYAYAASGRTDKAGEILATLQKRAKEGYVPAYEIAVVHAALGETDQAFKYLDKAFQERYVGMFYLNLKRNLLWRPLHTDPRYSDILRQMNFLPESAAARD